MIIECKNCLKKFNVRDSDIPSAGRTVQCSNCSTKWHQNPVGLNDRTLDLVKERTVVKRETSTNLKKIQNKELDLTSIHEASDGNSYKFLGSQWAILLPSGKMGKLATKRISNELNKVSGRKIARTKKKIKKDSDASKPYRENQNGVSLIVYLMIFIFFITSAILLLDTFKSKIIPFWPDLDIYLVYIFESLNNIFVIVKDLFNNYK